MSKLRKNKRFIWPIIIVAVSVLVAGGVVGIHTHNVHKAQAESGAIPTSKKLKSDSTGSKTKSTTTSSNQSDGSSTPSTDKSTSTSTNSSVALIAPFGTFVSNHRPGNGSPTSEQSVCNTTPGATCDIQFINAGGITKTLGAQTTDTNGSTYWSWNVNGATLAPGSWKITAVAKLNGQTQSATDPMPLEVQ